MNDKSSTRTFPSSVINGTIAKSLNESAVASLEEGLEETLTLHRLGVFPQEGMSFKTTHGLENMTQPLGRYPSRVDRWRTSDRRHRWIATALRDMLRRARLRAQAHTLKEAA